MAITAWSAKVSSSAICLLGERPDDSPRRHEMTPIGWPSRSIGDGQHGPVDAAEPRRPRLGILG